MADIVSCKEEGHDFARGRVITGRRGTWYTQVCRVCGRSFACTEAEWEELEEPDE